MTLSLQDIGKRYNRHWVFRHVGLELNTGEHIAILGPNGSGKSTFLQIILGSMAPSEGVILMDGQELDAEKTLGKFSMSAPYLELIEEYSLAEMIGFHGKLMPFRNGLSTHEVIAQTGLEEVADRQLSKYSSGMKQRVKLALALLSDTPFVLLDEPTANLDKKAIEWYAQLVADNSHNRTLLVASNSIEAEYAFCQRSFQINQ